VPSMQAFEEMMKGVGIDPEIEKRYATLMDGYHDLVDYGRREVYKIEG